ncbi:MAG TPA: hypothetical protein VM509_03705 [Planctomycetota bacterium]|nr:hypothetical protein [Planctomycetota bacterium]
MSHPPFSALALSGDWSWLVLALLGACAVAAWVAVARLGEIERRLKALERGDDSPASASGSMKARESIDLRRIEQVLIEMRDGSKRLEDALLRSQRAAGASGLAGSSAGSPAGATGVDLGERVTNRMLALGYERIVVVTPREQFTAIFESGGEVQVEARRDGAPCKGKAVFRGGALVDVVMQSAYATFP